MTNMRATCGTRSFLRTCALTCLLFLLCSTCAGAATQRNVASHPSTLKRSRRSHQSAKHMGAHHRPLTDEQKADQNLQFMLSLYRSAAEPDGRPKQHRKFGSNTVRLLRPTASSVHYRPASGGELRENITKNHVWWRVRIIDANCQTDHQSSNEKLQKPNFCVTSKFHLFPVKI